MKEKAHEFDITEEYKKMMDKILDKHNTGQLEYLSQEEFRGSGI